MFESLRISDLPIRQCGVLRPPSDTRPAIWVVEENGTRAVVKDYSRGKFLYRNTVGRFLLWREIKAYRRLSGLRRVPTLYGVIDSSALLMEEIPGKRLKKRKGDIELSEAFFQALQRTIEDFHRRGIAHCDLKNASNVLVGNDGMPYIVDWNASISEREFRFFPLNLIYRRFVLDDNAAITKLKLQYLPDLLTPEEKRRYEHRSVAERGVRAVRDFLREIFKRIA
jgi:serine/threonine protein kinase